MSLTHFNYVQNLPGLILIKDLESRYVNISHVLAKMCGWSSVEAAIDKFDYDAPCEAATLADDFITMDRLALASKQKVVSLDVINYVTGWSILLTEVSPIVDQAGRVEGVLNMAVEISKYNPLYHYYLKLAHSDSQFTKKKSSIHSYILTQEHVPLPLTIRQSECLFWLMRGKTVKEIAHVLRLSPRTVEEHICNIKEILQCKNKSELIEKAFDAQFLNYLPAELANKTLAFISN